MAMNSILSRDTVFKLSVAISHSTSPEIGWSQILTGRAYIAPFSPLEDDVQRSEAAALTIADAAELARICGAQADSLAAAYWERGADDDDAYRVIDVFMAAQGAFEEISGNLDVLPPTMTISEYLKRFRRDEWRLPAGNQCPDRL